MGLGLAAVWGRRPTAVRPTRPCLAERDAAVLFLIASVLTVVWPFYRREVGPVVLAVVLSLVPLLVVAALSVKAWRKPVRLPAVAGFPICWSCHSALHIRFTKPEWWEKRKEIIRAQRKVAGVTTDGWWETLTLEPIDINPKHVSG